MLRIGCQTFTWEMLGGAWKGGPDDLLAAIGAAGYAGIEITDTMIGGYFDDPAGFARALAANGLDLVAYTIASDSGFSERDAIGADLAAVDKALAFTGRFPGAMLTLGSATAVSPGEAADKLAVAAGIYNAAASRGAAAGVAVAIHPSSHHNTLLLTRADYDALFTRLDPAVGWVPDTGHLLRGGHAMMDTLATYRDRIRYLHLKDVDTAGTWAMLGEGVCDTRAVIDLLAAAPAFNGWLVVEEESEEAGRDPAAAVRRNRDTMRGLVG